MPEAPQAHPDPDGVPLAPHPALHPDGYRTAVVDLGPEVFQIHPGLPAGVAAAACRGRGERAVAGATGGLILHHIGHLLGEDVFAEAVHEGGHHQRQVHLPAKAGVVGAETVFRQVEPPVDGVAFLFFPGHGPHGSGQQPEGRGDFIVVGGEVDLQLHAGAAAGGCHRDRVPHQEDHAVLALGVDAAPGVIRGPLAKAHPARPGVACIHAAAHLHHGVVGSVGIPAHVQVAERGHGKLWRGVAAVLQVAARRAVQHDAAALQRHVIQLPAGERLGALQHQIVPLLHGSCSPFCRSKFSVDEITLRLRPARRPALLQARRRGAFGSSPQCGTPGPGRHTRSGSRLPPGTRSRTPA